LIANNNNKNSKIVVQVDASIKETLITNETNVKPITSIAKSTVDVSLLERFILKEIKKTTYGNPNFNSNSNDESSKPLSYSSSTGASYKNSGILRTTGEKIRKKKKR